MPSAYATGIALTDIDDFVNNTLDRYEKNVWQDISTELQRYFAFDNMLLNGRVAVDGGSMLQWQIKTRNTGSATNTGLYAEDVVQTADVTKKARIGWTFQTANMAYDVREDEFNSPDAHQIVNLLKLRRHDALTSFAGLMEQNFWGLPGDATNAVEMQKPLGVPYWIVRNATKGFTGTVWTPSGFTTVAEMSPTTYPNWRNFAGSYRVIDKHDLVRLLREATVKCNFKQPIAQSSPSSEPPRYVIATVYEVIQKMEELLESQNQNLGNDVASKDGDTLFRKVPMTWVPFLDANHDPLATDANNPYGKNPVYGIDRGTFRVVFKRGDFMRKSPPMVAPRQHNGRHIHWDSAMNFQCFNRRSNFLVTQAA